MVDVSERGIAVAKSVAAVLFYGVRCGRSPRLASGNFVRGPSDTE